jgi:hypothetical protein
VKNTNIMTPEELRKIAIEAAKPQVEEVKRRLAIAAENAEQSIKIPRNLISELAIEILKEEGYKIERGTKYPPRSVFRQPTIQYWEISFK